MAGRPVTMKTFKLSTNEKTIEKALLRGKYRPVSDGELKDIARAIEQKKKDTVLNIRLNSQDLKRLKMKARRLGLPYQTFIAEILHRFAA